MPNLRAFTFGNARRRRVVVRRVTPPGPAIDLTNETWTLNRNPQTGQKRFAHAPASAFLCSRLIAVSPGQQWQMSIRVSGSKGQRLTLRLVVNADGRLVAAIRPQLPANGSITRSGGFAT